MRGTIVSWLGLCLAACGYLSAETLKPDQVVSAAMSACAVEGASCGQGGACSLGRCLPQSGTCATDVDCDDAESCTSTRCENGACVATPQSGQPCTLAEGGGKGVCDEGRCGEIPPKSCDRAADCATIEHGCTVHDCVGNGCRARPADDGVDCRMATGLAGTCRAGQCRPPALLPEETLQRCTWSTSRATGEDGSLTLTPRKICRDRPALHFGPAALAQAEGSLISAIYEAMGLAVRVSLVPLGDGGYRAVIQVTDDGPPADPVIIAMIASHQANRDGWRLRVIEAWGHTGGWSIALAEDLTSAKGPLTLAQYGWFREGMTRAKSGFDVSAD